MVIWGLPPNNRGIPGGSAGEEPTYNVGDLGSVPGLGRCPGEGKVYPLQYSDLENSLDYTSPGICKELDTTEWLSLIYPQAQHGFALSLCLICICWFLEIIGFLSSLVWRSFQAVPGLAIGKRQQDNGSWTQGHLPFLQRGQDSSIVLMEIPSIGRCSVFTSLSLHLSLGLCWQVYPDILSSWLGDRVK